MRTSSDAKYLRLTIDSGDPTMPAAAAPPPELPEDLICGSILPRLPVRSLLRFATVCKAWRDLILRNPAFAALQAGTPSPASVALARFHNGRLKFLGRGPGAALVAPPDPSLSFLTTTGGGADQRLFLCASTAGLLLCLTSEGVLVVCNPATRRFDRIRYDCPRGVAGLAYDPAAAAPAARGYDVVVAATQGTRTCRFFRFSSRTAASVWRAAAAVSTVRLGLFEDLLPKSACVGRRLHWLTSRGNIVWHDAGGEASGTLSPPAWGPSGARLEGNMDLAEWRGRLRLACTSSAAGIGVWELASYGGGGAGARWVAVHRRSWSAVPGVVAAARCSMWSVVPAGMETGGEEAVGLAVRYGMDKNVWYRALVRYDTGTGKTATKVELAGKKAHDDLGVVFGYHSSLAALRHQ